MDLGQKDRKRLTVTNLLVLAFLMVFVYQVFLNVSYGSAALTSFVNSYAFIEQDFLAGQYYRVFTSIFLHAGLLHLASNSAIFYLAGNPLERKVGPLKFFILFIAAGVAGSLLTALLLNVGKPAIGASGGVFGIVAAASLLVPTSSYLEEIPVLRVFSLPVIRLLFSVSIVGVYFVFQETVMASLQVMSLVENNVGHVAHLGGIITGGAFSFFGYPEETIHSIKYSVPLVGLLLALVMLPNFTQIWFGVLTVFVLFLVYWSRSRDKKADKFSLD